MKKEDVKYELMKDLPFGIGNRVQTEKEWKKIIQKYNLDWIYMKNTGWFKEVKHKGFYGIDDIISQRLLNVEKRLTNLENQLHLMKFPNSNNAGAPLYPKYQPNATNGTVPPEWEAKRLDTVDGEIICDLTEAK